MLSVPPGPFTFFLYLLLLLSFSSSSVVGGSEDADEGGSASASEGLKGGLTWKVGLWLSAGTLADIV